MTTDADPWVRPPALDGTDITQEARALGPAVPFTAFVARHLKRLTNAVALVIDDESAAHRAVTAALEEMRRDWDEIGGLEQARRRLFTRSLELALVDSESTDESVLRSDPDPEVVSRACVLARHGLGWTSLATSELLDLTVRQVDDLVRSARTRPIFASEVWDGAAELSSDELEDLPERTRLALKTSRAPVPDGLAVDHAFEHAEQRRLQRIGAAVAVVVLIVVIAGTALIDGPDVAAPVLDDRADRVVAEIVQSPAERENRPAFLAVRESVLPDGVTYTWETPMEPDLVVADGDGGFLGANLQPDESARVVFLRSSNGIRWTETVPSKLPIDRMEYSGDGFVAWASEYGSQSGNQSEWPEALIMSGMEATDGMVNQFVLEETSPTGLEYEFVITDIARNDDRLLVLIRTDVAVDLAALELTEADTCGRTVEPEQVSLDLCDGGAVDVLEFAGIESLPPTYRLFTGESEGPLRNVDLGIELEGSPGIDLLDGRFVVTDGSGLPIASSTDGGSWASSSISTPAAMNILAASVAESSEMIVGVGRDGGDRLVLFRYGGEVRKTEWSLLRNIVGEPIDPVGAVVERSGDVWTVLVYDIDGRAWMASSTEGRGWSAQSIDSIGERPRVILGDRALLVHSVDQQGEADIQVFSRN